MPRLVTLLVLLLTAGKALAAPGDRLQVRPAGADLLGQPAAGADILLRLPGGEPVVERRRWDVWVAVLVPARGTHGWIHTSLLALPRAQDGRAADGEDPAPAQAEALRRFRGALARANRAYVAADGPLPFVGARLGAPGTAQVVVRRAWMARSHGSRSRELALLLDRWVAVMGEQGGLRLEIIDMSGHVLMSRAWPDEPALSLADGDDG